jgi:hypothetical protein
MGFIKSVSPILDFGIVEENGLKSELHEDNNGKSKVTEKEEKSEKKKQDNNQQQRLQGVKFRIKKKHENQIRLPIL